MKIISIKRGFCCDHSAAYYDFISLKKLSKKQQKQVLKIWHKECVEREINKELSAIDENGLAFFESWLAGVDDMEDILIEKYFDIMLRRNEIISSEVLKFGYDYTDQLYESLKKCDGFSSEAFAHIYVKEINKQRIILEILFYIEESKIFQKAFSPEFYDFLKGLWEDILKGDLTPLRVIGEFYSIKAKVDWKELGPPTERAKKLKKMLSPEREI